MFLLINQPRHSFRYMPSIRDSRVSKTICRIQYTLNHENKVPFYLEAFYAAQNSTHITSIYFKVILLLGIKNTKIKLFILAQNINAIVTMFDVINNW